MDKTMKDTKRFRVEYSKHGRGNWSTVFWIDHQGFTIVSNRTKKEAIWFGKCIKTAFLKLQFKDDE